MPFFDMPLEELQKYQPQRTDAPDFDAFWQATLAEARSHPLNATFTPCDSGLTVLEAFDVSYSGYGGQTIKAWLILPRQRAGKLPCVVEYIGYGGGRGLPIEWLHYASAGFAHLIMDTRGQGSSWRTGDTPDLESDGGNAQFPGFMTRGVLDPKTYFYRRVYTDAVRAVEAARAHPAVDPARVAVTGGSQGGAITVAVSGLEPTVAAAMPDVPFLCHFKRATTIIGNAPYNEISKYLQVHRDKVQTVFNTLSYFDGMNLAARAGMPSLWSVGLMDDICPPSTVYAAYNHYTGPKEIEVYEFNNHEGGGVFHLLRKINYLNRLWGLA